MLNNKEREVTVLNLIIPFVLDFSPIGLIAKAAGMLKFKTLRIGLLCGRKVPEWKVFPFIRSPQTTGVKLALKIDTGADYTVLPASMAPQIGIDPSALRRTRPYKVSSASTQGLTGYLWPVEFDLQDDYFGFAVWTGDALFCDPDPRVNCAGKVGFLEYLRFSDVGPHFCLDPVPGFPGSHQCTQPQ
jgi:hypothetical protein